VVLEDQAFHGECLNFADELHAAGTNVVLSNFLRYEVLNGLVNTFVRGAWEDHKARSHDFGLTFVEFRDARPALLKTLASQIEQAERAATFLLRSYPRKEYAIEPRIRHETLRLIKEFGLYPGDALHAATALSAEVGDIVTLDFDFSALPREFTIWQPEALIRRRR
jgi:predicted nucleic acid-binding protein